jgi:AsmA-like C-terminal region
MAVATPPRLNQRRSFLVLYVALGIVLAVIIIAAILLHIYWPFTQSAVIKSLEDASSSRVTLKNFHATYFPYPGCVAEDVVFRRGSNTSIPPLITIPELTIQSSFFALFGKRITYIRADGMTVFIPSQSTTEKFRSSSNVVIDELIANNSTLEFQSRTPGKAPTKFAVHEFTLRGVAAGRALLFHVKLANPDPPGEITANGKLGPWRLGSSNQTPVSGEYVFEHADLGALGGVTGLLSSTGKFDGTLVRIGVHGTTDVPNFLVGGSSHKVDLKASFNAFVNARTGDIQLDSVDSQFWRTNVLWTGTIARQGAQKTRVADLQMNSKDGRIEDLLKLFITAQQSPFTGVTSFHAHILLPSGKSPFLKKVQLQGDFGVGSGSFTQPQTQQDVNKLSAEAQSENPQDAARALSDLKGHVILKDGIARFSDLSFTVPGAFAIMQGTYDLIGEKINLHGVLRLDSSLSNLASGPKALVLKVLQPFFRRKSHGSKVAVKITGTYNHPSFGVDLTAQKETATTRRLRRLYHKPTK